MSGNVPALPQRRAAGDAVFASSVRVAGLFVLLLLGSIILVLLQGSVPAFLRFGWGFVASTTWNPVREVFGAGVAIYGTLVTAVLSLLLAVPVAFGIAFYLTELATPTLRRPIGVAIELLAAIPSIIYGMWGFYVVRPLMAPFSEWVGSGVDGVPWLGFFLRGSPSGSGVFTAALILAIMIVPFIAATMRDVFTTVSPMLKESAYGLGCTRWEVMRRVVLPTTRASVIGGIMLGLGRALGETMAVTFVIGNTNRLMRPIFDQSLFAPGNTIASLVALEFPESGSGSPKQSSLLALGFILFVISFTVLALSRLLLRPRMKA